MNINIILLSNKYQIIKYLYIEYLWTKLSLIFFNQLNGTSCDESNYIFILAYNFGINNDEYKEINKLHCIQTIMHEIRHQFQRIYMPDKYRKYALNKQYRKQVAHKNRWEEIDARNFSSNFMNENYKQIIKLI